MNQKVSKVHLILVIGASASGKSTFARALVDQGDTYTIRSLMTRDRRDSDSDLECAFCSRNQFQYIVETGGMLEFEQFNGNYYGTSASELTQVVMNNQSVKVIDPRGAKSIIDHVLNDENLSSVINLHLVLVESDHNTLIKRLVVRGGPQVDERIVGLKEELEACQALFQRYDDTMDVNKIYVDGEKPFPDLQFSKAYT